MPYAHIRKKIPRSLDRRVKLDDNDKQVIKELYSDGLGVRPIARIFEGICSRRMVSFILFPEKAERQRMLHKERRKDGRYYNKEKWRAQMRSHRRYKQSIKNKLI